MSGDIAAAQRRFRRYIGIDYSGAATPETGLPGLRVYVSSPSRPPREVTPPAGGPRHWSRRAVADWLARTLAVEVPAIVGIDHGFSFPQAWFERHGLSPDWEAFLVDFQAHWPCDQQGVRVEDVRRGRLGRAAARSGDSRWRRLTEQRSGAAKSVFHFDVQGSVAKSTHAGLPWLLHLRRRLGTRVHVWPFDGWEVSCGCSVLAEAYPRLYSEGYPRRKRTPDQQDAYSIAAWLRDRDGDGTLGGMLCPVLPPAARRLAAVEGWVLGVR